MDEQGCLVELCACCIRGLLAMLLLLLLLVVVTLPS
jgi:hypothetical protein